MQTPDKVCKGFLFQQHHISLLLFGCRYAASSKNDPIKSILCPSIAGDNCMSLFVLYLPQLKIPTEFLRILRENKFCKYTNQFSCNIIELYFR